MTIDPLAFFLGLLLGMATYFVGKLLIQKIRG